MNMKKEMTLTERNTSFTELSNFITDATAWFQTPMEWLRKYYSAVLEREVSSKQASYITQAQLALILAILPIIPSLLVQVFNLVWFGLALYKCKKANKST
jgi:hypothetical protein